MRQSLQKCPICQNGLLPSSVRTEDHGNILHYQCRYCGNYQLNGHRMIMRFGIKDNQFKRNAELSMALRHKFERTGSEVMLSHTTLDSILESQSIPESSDDYALNVLKYLYAHSDSVLKPIVIPVTDYPLLYAKEPSETLNILKMAENAGYIEHVEALADGSHQCTFTDLGIQKISANDYPRHPLNQRKLMELAIEEMKKSKADPGRESQNPKVGAVISTPEGDVVAKAHRGELRIGDHAEFTAIERKCRNINLEGYIMYTTLEPCAPGARHEPKLCCAERIINARMAKVIIGHTDPHPSVETRGIRTLIDYGVVVEYFDKDLATVINQENRVYFDYALEEQKKHKSYPVLLKQTTLEEPISNKSVQDLAPELLTKLKEKIKIADDIYSPIFLRNLDDLGVLDKKAKTKDYVPTAMGFIMFSRDASLRFPQSRIKFTVEFKNSEPIIKDFEGPLLLMPEIVEEFLDINMPQWISREQFERTDVYASLKKAIREVVINAIVHRDYSINGQNIQIILSKAKNTISVSSPGIPLVEFDRFESFNVPSVNRNPKMAYIFFKMGFIEERGIGLKELQKINGEGYAVEFNLELNVFETTISIQKTADPFRTILSQLMPEEASVLQIVVKNKSISSSQIAKALNLPPRSVRRYIESLKDKGLLFQKGKGPATVYKPSSDLANIRPNWPDQ